VTLDGAAGELTLWRLRMPLVVPFETSFGTQRDKDVLILSINFDGVTGWGECCAPAEPGYSEEYLDSAAHVIEHFLLPRMAFATGGATSLAAAFAGVRGHHMAKAAVEMAVLDLELKTKQMSFASYFGGTRDRVEAGVSVGIFPSIPELLTAIEGYLRVGYRRIKLKIAPGWDLEPVQEVRREFGTDLPLQVDANCAYTRSDTRLLRKFDDCGLEMIEQPFVASDMMGHAQLAKVLETPICLDESIHGAHDTVAALGQGACSIVNIKPGRVGGYLEARRVAFVGHAMGAQVWCGGMVDTGIARAANLAFASLPELTLPGDTSESARFFEVDITPPHQMIDGYMPVPTGPGIGVEVLTENVRRFEVEHRTLRIPQRALREPQRVLESTL